MFSIKASPSASPPTLPVLQMSESSSDGTPAVYSSGSFIRHHISKETLLRYTLLIAIDDDGEADDRGEKLVRESSTQYLQISSEGGESQLQLRMMQ